MDMRSGQTASAARSPAANWADHPRRWARTAWAPAWLRRRPRPLRIAVRTVAIILLILFAIWLILFVTKGRFLKGPFERFATAQLERQVDVGGDFQLYFAQFNFQFYPEDLTIANPASERATNFLPIR